MRNYFRRVDRLGLAATLCRIVFRDTKHNKLEAQD